MKVLMIVVFFIFGLMFGSFYNVVGLRVPLKQPFVNDRSNCPQCQHTLTWYELIPVLSYLLQKGKCLHCQKEISNLYPIIELSTGFLFVLSYMSFGIGNIELIVSLLLISMLMIIFVSDLKYMVIPNRILLFFLPFFIILRIIQPLDPWWTSIVGAFIGYGVIAIIIFMSRGGMGAGDMKLFGVLGIVLGTNQILLAFFLSCVIGTIISICLICMRMIDRKQPIPFGPYIVVATIITYFYGDYLVQWYINLF